MESTESCERSPESEAPGASSPPRKPYHAPAIDETRGVPLVTLGTNPPQDPMQGC